MFVNLVQFGYFVLFGLLKGSIGPSRSGKTQLLLNLIMRWLQWDKLSLVAPSVDDQKCYNGLKDFEEKANSLNEHGDGIIDFITEIDEALGVEDLDGSNNNLVVYDDVMLDKQSNPAWIFSRGQALVGKTRSDVTLVIEFVNYPRSCDKINIFFNRFQYSSSRIRLYHDEHVITFNNNGVQCLSIIGYKYETRIVNVSINFPTHVTFGLRNVSVYDSGRYFINDISSENFGKRLLLVGEAGTCVPPPRATFPRFECRMNGSRITITLTSVQMEDEGLYALIGSTSRIAYQSEVLHVIDKSFENYFVGGGVVAGMTIVILICWFLFKRCYEIRGNGADGDDYNTVDVHYYCSIRNQNESVTQSEATTGSVPESQQLSAVMD